MIGKKIILVEGKNLSVCNHRTHVRHERCLVNIPDVIDKKNRCLIFECLFGLRPIHVQIYFFTTEGPKTIKEIAQHVNRDRTTVVRLLQRLMKMGLVMRKEEKLNNGGIRYTYVGVSEEKLKQQLKDVVREVEKAINEFINEDWGNMPD